MRLAAAFLSSLIGAKLALAQAPVVIGPLSLSIHEGRTAQLFHVVDQLAEWDPRTHRSYVRWAHASLPLSAADSAMLASHAALRRASGWNSGVEAAFYTDLPIDSAARIASLGKRVTKEHAASERAVLQHFAVRLAPMLDSMAGRTHAFALRVPLARDSIVAAMQQAIHLSGMKQPLSVPVFIVPNPATGARGGRYVARRVIIEVPDAPDAMQSLYHELFHVLMAPHQGRLRAVATKAGVSYDELNEALAYAFSPGLTDPSDPLSREAAREGANRVFGLAALLRPILRDALTGSETMDAFLRHAGEQLRFSSLYRTSRQVPPRSTP